MARGAECNTYRSICDFAVEGSPIKRTFMSLKRKFYNEKNYEKNNN
jgi:hypothetical protein